MEITKYSKEQLISAAVLYVEVYKASPWNESWDMGSAAKHLEHNADGQSALGFTAWDDGTIVGVLIGRNDYWQEKRTFTIKELYVRHQRQGIGSQLLQHCEGYLIDKGVSRVFLRTRRNTPAAQFYGKHGYTSHYGSVHLGKSLEAGDEGTLKKGLRSVAVRLETDRLIIREHEYADIEGYHKWISDQDVMRYVAGFPRTRTKEASIVSLTEAIRSSFEEPRAKYFVAIELKDTEEYIGSGGGIIKSNQGTGGIMGIGYFFIKDYWNQGYATEATRAWINYSFETLGVHKIVASCDVDNHSSEKIMQKCDMKRESYLRERRYREGAWRDGLQYAILKNEWEQLRTDPNLG